MTDCNDNQLVVKAQIENDCAAAQNQQVATADQPTAQQTAPATSGVSPGTPHRVGVQTPGQSQPATAPDVSHEVTIATTEGDAHVPIDVDLQISDMGAYLSDLDRIGLGTRVVQTTRASGATLEAEQPSTSKVDDSQTAHTQQNPPEQKEGADTSGVDILDLGVEGSEDFSDIDIDLADELLGGSPEEMIQNWVTKFNQDVTSGLDQETQPDLERDFTSLELADGEGPEASVRTVSSVVQVPATSSLSAATQETEREKPPATIAAQPGLSLRRRTFRIEGVGEFRREDGQPTALYAYPPVVRPIEPMEGDPDQAYKGQDLVDPMVIRPRHTRRERLQKQEETQKKRQTAPGLPVAVGTAGATERVWYRGAQVIETQPKPWTGDFSQSTDCATLTRCDQQVVAAAKEKQLVPQQGPTAAMVTPSYLTIVTPTEDAILTVQTAMEVSAAFPYARGQSQEPLGERVIVNDFYGVPLYKPAVGPIDPDLRMGAVAAKKIITKTGADPNFVFDQAKRNPERASAYEMGFRPLDPGPMRYACRMEDCCAVGGMRLAFSTEEELIAHWNTFHVAVAPQFTCQVQGCKATFSADPGALDCYLSHVGQKMAEEKDNLRFRGDDTHWSLCQRTFQSSPIPSSSHPRPSSASPDGQPEWLHHLNASLMQAQD